MPKKRYALYGMGALGGIIGLIKILKRKTLKSKAVIVLGNGRSGTSVLARAINFMGVDLGTDKFVKKKPANPKGYFENKRILQIHKKIGSKLKYRPSPSGYERRLGIRTYKKELKEYIQKEFLDNEVWGWKDPRTNDYLELWQDILKELHVEPHYLIIIRNPADVVASNKRAWDRDEIWSLRQWQLRTLFSLRNTYGGKRVIVSYEELFNNSLECLRRIAQDLKLPWPKNETKLKNKLDVFIDPNLQTSHSNTTLEDFINREDIGQDVKDLYSLALEGTRSQAYFQSQSFHDRVEKLYQAYLHDHGKLKRNPPKQEA